MKTHSPQPRRRRRRLRDGRALALLATTTTTMASTLVAGARAASGSDGDDDDDAGPVSADLKGGAKVLVDQLKLNGDAMLLREFPKIWSGNAICDSGAFVLSRDGPSNRNCMAALNEQGLSCTCLEGFVKKLETWTFRVTQKTKTTGTPVKSLSSGTAIPVTKIAPFQFTKPVKEVRLIGDGAEPTAIEFVGDVDADGTKSSIKLASSGSKAALERVYIDNVNMDIAARETGFFKTELTELTLKNCGLTDGSVEFVRTLASVTRINLENNRFTSIPPELLFLPKLEEVFLQGNNITNVTVTEKEYKIIKAMKAFSLDPQATASGSCTGALKPAQNINICVSDATSQAGNQAIETAPSSGTNKYLLIGAIVGGVVVVVLIFLVVRRRSAKQKQDAFVKQQTTRSYPEDTLSFDQSVSQQSGVNSSLLNDPIIITHRIPFNDVKVATCLSRGGFGLVYSGTFNRRRVAIKRIRSELSADIKYIEAFLKEICLMASLSHPRIVEFVGVAWDSLRNLSAVTEFMERGDLRDVLHSSKARNAPLTWDGHKVRIAMHIAEALTYLHSLSPKVIHRDLKSKNVLLDSDMTAKLSDFGVSRERRFEETHMTAGIGTAFWIAPEVLLGMDYDERADIFSFGVVLSEIDTDDYPYWNEKNPASGGKQQENVILRMVATGALRPEFSPSCPGAILELAQLCLDVDPLKRPTAAEIAYRLQQLIRSSPLTPQSVASSDY